MPPLKLLLLSFSLITITSNAQKETVWENFKSSKHKGTEAILPDFSYAGYKYSEVPLPTNNDFKVLNITYFGAIPNDGKSDKKALIKAIATAKETGKSIVFFPKGKYHFFNDSDEPTPILIETSNILFRGESEEETILFFEKNLEPKDPNKLWTTPYMLNVTSKTKSKKLAKVITDSKRETFSIEVSDVSEIKKGDWVVLKVKNNSPEIIKSDNQPLQVQPEWKKMLEKGVMVNEIHKVATIKGNTLTFEDPIHYNVKAKHNWNIFSFTPLENVGFENLTFEGNWLEKFVHHKSAKHDGGWSILNISKSVNSWVKDCTFKNVNNALSFKTTAACTGLNITIKGSIGHSSVHTQGSTGTLLAKINDLAGMHHAAGVGGGSNTAAVIWRSKHPAHTCFESHASQPRCTLFDNVEGGFFAGRAGGARSSLPNHGRYLVLWNYKETDTPEDNFKFVATDTWFWKIVPPIIVGFHGAGTTFKEDEVQILESLGTPVKPESLFEEQLKLRLGKLPEWIEKIK